VLLPLDKRVKALGSRAGQDEIMRRSDLAYFNLRVVDELQQLVEFAHVEPFSAARTLHEMIGLGFGDAVRIEAAIIPSFRHRSRASFWRP
jgi:hypothetical protein